MARLNPNRCGYDLEEYRNNDLFEYYGERRTLEADGIPEVDQKLVYISEYYEQAKNTHEELIADGYIRTGSLVFSESQAYAWYERKLSHTERYILWHRKTYPDSNADISTILQR